MPDAAQASADPGATWSLNVRQPWALKEAKVSELTDEQKEFMATYQKEKEEQGGTGRIFCSALAPLRRVLSGQLTKYESLGHAASLGPIRAARLHL